MKQQTSFSVRKTDSTKAIIFIHGFSGEAHTTFGMLPAFLAGDRELVDWDIHCFGYPTSLFPDITGVWSADPDLTVLSGYLSSALISTRYNQYTEIAIIAHSMGGLIAQRSLLNDTVAQRINHVFLFGTPSNGLQKAGLLRLFKRQVRDMASGSPFITQLRLDWTNKYTDQLPFNFRVIAGIRDEFVPVSSSVNIFGEQHRAYVAGNHLEMVKPATAEEEIVFVIKGALSASEGVDSVLGSSHLAGYFEIIATLGDQEELATEDLVRLVLALEMVGQQERAITLLDSQHTGSAELTGTLAGRFKRQWLANPLEKTLEGERAYELYKQGFDQALQQLDHYQAFYNGINVAFLELALHRNRYNARTMAVHVLEQCNLAPREKWRLATEGEAQLYLGEFDYALDCYDAALQMEPEPREIDSMYKQAIWSARLLESVTSEQRLEKLFAPFVSL
ncbi:alpha/beta fold hydrolase [Hymenobacter actinosclerus]|uniref:PGAP1-like protein n=1 Tax=Hymenobacter actinosclerus TaxID=82805 RepID=A0A1I0J9C4_9BACT|nr:alpha/beta fold hydrolase [Hymenobacter actinosclerus]SEU06451.1 PGAP1-like protein [Hymenobacter actinosclerus]